MKKEEVLGVFGLVTGFTMSPSIRTAPTLVGLVQMGEADANAIGTTTGALRNMSRAEQVDWIEKHLYSKFSWLGVLLMALIDVLLFGWIGLTIWAVQMVWIPFWAAGVINGVGHYYGYKNGDSNDSSSNIVPWGIIIGGEELHNNHHLDPANPKLSKKWFEIDIGWIWFLILERLKLARRKT